MVSSTKRPCEVPYQTFRPKMAPPRATSMSKPKMLPTKITESDDDFRGQRENPRQGPQTRWRKSARPPEQQGDHAAGDGQDSHRYKTRADLTARCNLTFFSMYVERRCRMVSRIPPGLARLHHVYVQRVENLRRAAHRGGKSGRRFDLATRPGQDLFERNLFSCWPARNLETLNERADRRRS